MTKRWLDTLVESSLRFVKGALALALCVGTFAVALTVVGVSPAAAAAAPAIVSVSPPTGLPAGGTKVTISGSGFTGATAVDFGTGNPAVITGTPTAGKITIDTSPASALPSPGFGTVDITVTTPSGTSAIVPADEFTYIGAPTVTALYGGNGPDVGGPTIIIQGTNLTGATIVDFATTAATSFTVLSSTEISAVVPPIGSEAVGGIFNVTVTTGAGVSAKATANQWYWFGSGSCAFSGTGVENSGAPPGASAYIQDAVAGTSTTNPSGGTVIPTACSGLTDLGTLAPMIESLGGPTAAVVTGTGPGGAGGNEEWLGWSGANDYSVTEGSTYTAPSPGFQLPETGPSTSGGCPVSTSLCLSAAPTPTYYGTDPDATCPPSQAQTDAGLVNCSVVALAAKSATPPLTYIAATLEVSYTNDPTPDPATATFTSGTTAPGGTVTLNSCSTCNWWGSGSAGAPSFVPPIGQLGKAVAVPNPAVWVGSTRADAVEASMATNTIAITPASYDCGSSGGASTSPPGPVANCTLAQGTISGSFVMPTVTCSPCNVYVDEPNLSLTQSTYAADGGTGTYNNGLTYDLVNSVESTTAISCPTCASGTPAPTVTVVNPNNGPTGGGTPVTLTGTGFTGATAVDFGSTPGTDITGVTATGLTVNSPPGTGTVNVTVTTPNGTSAANPPSDQYTYNAPAAPTVTLVNPNNGPTGGGTPVTLTGTGFTGATAVDFGSTPGTDITGVTATGLTVNSPPGTGTVNVTVTTPNGTSAANPPSDQYTYNAPAAPTVTLVNPNNGPTGGGTPVTLTGTGFTGATAVDFGSTPGTDITGVTATGLTVNSPPGTGTVDVTVTTPNGTSAANPPSDQYTYNAPPTVTVVNPNNGPQAGGTLVTLTGTGFVSGSTAVDFGTKAGTGVSVSSGTTLTVNSPAGSGVVSVTVSTTGGGSSTPLASAYTYNAPPTVTVVNPNNGSPGGGTSVTLTGTGFTGATAVDFGSTPGTDITGVTATGLTVNSPPGTGTVDVTVTTPNGTSAANPPSDQYTYDVAPTVTVVNPNNGPQAGGTLVTLTGTGFVLGSTVVDFGSIAGTDVTVSSGTTLTVNSPAGSGVVSVTVSTTGGGSSTPLADAYTYNAPPTVTVVNPNNGPQAGGTLVTLTGTGFVLGSTVVDFGSNQGTGVSVSSGTTLTVNSPAGSGVVSVTVSTTGGGASTPLADAYTYNAPPTVTVVNPNNGPQAGGTLVTLTGTGFVPGSTAVDFGTKAGTGVSVSSGTTLTVNSPAGSGVVSVTVSTTGGGSSTPLASAYTYNAPPTVTVVNPNNGSPGGGTSVTLTGTGFTGATAVDFGSTPGTDITGVTATGLTVNSPPGTGTVDVTVTTPNGTSAANPPSDQYTYDVAPTVTVVNPNNGPQAGGTLVTLTGTGFVLGSTVVDFGSIAGTDVTVSSGTTLTVNSPAGSGVVSVTVSTTGGGSSTPLADAYTYNAPPTVTVVNPNNGPQAGGTLVTLTGTGFVLGSTVVDFGSNQGTGVSVSSGTTLTVNSPAGSGVVSVTVSTTGGGASTPLADAYTYNAPPTVTVVNPNNGPQAGGTLVTLTGTGFVPGSTAVDFGTKAGTGVSVSSGTTLTVNSPAGSGVVSVTVSTTGGGSSTPLASAYTYNAPPTVTVVNPNNGSPGGGTSVTLTGTGFTGATAVDFGSTPGTDITGVTATGLTVNSPPGTGTVDVTVTTPNGTSAANPPSDQYTYDVAPTVTVVNPNNGPQAGGTLVTLTGTGFVLGSTVVDFGSIAGTDVTVSSGTTLTVNSPAGSGVVSVTVSTTGGGASTPLADAYTYNAPPTVTVVNPNNGPQAGGTLVTLTGTGFVPGSTVVDFGSNQGTGVSVSSGTTLTVNSPAGSGVVSVTVSTTGGGASTPLADAYTYNAPPTVTVVNPNNGPQAGGTLVTLTGTGFVPGSTVVDFGSNQGTDVSVSSGTTLTVNSPAGSGVVSVTVSTTGSGSSTPLASAYTYNAPPTVISVKPSGGPTGGGTSVTLTGTGFTGATAVDFGSTPGTDITGVTATGLTVNSPPGTGTVDVTVTTPNGTSAANPPGDQYTYDAPPTITSVSPSQGSTSGGTVVTIDGTNLASPSVVAFGGNAGTVTASSASSITVTTPASSAGLADVLVMTFGGSVTDTGAFTYVAPVVTKPSTTQGYWEVGSDGGVFSFGGAPFHGSAGSLNLNEPIVGMASTPDGGGYWLVGKDGGIFAYGDTHSYGSRSGLPLNAPIVGMASTPDGGGYWLVANDGGVFAYGDAHYYGSRGGQPLNAPIVGIASTPDGGGYWLVASDGGVFAYGDARYQGSRGGQPLNAPIVGMAATPGGGYWLVAKDGGVFSYGGAQFYGSAGAMPPDSSVTGMVSSADGGGYWLATTNGGSLHYGDATPSGSEVGQPLNEPIVGIVLEG